MTRICWLSFIIGFGTCAMVVLCLAFAFLVVLEFSRPAAAHDPYTGLTVPTRPGVSCCNQRDCGPVKHRYRDGRPEVRLCDLHDQNCQWREVPLDSILPDPSPDGQWHACALHDYGVRGPIRCIWAPLLGEVS